MDTPSTQINQLNNAVVELRRVAHLEGIETLLIVAANHKPDNLEHRFHSVGSIGGCDSCAMESLGRLIGTQMDEMMIAGFLNALQTAYAVRSRHIPCTQAVDEAREVVLS